ncbi:MAG: hypothetical protein ACOCX3_03785 [Chloroflexota bacterium]
MRANTEKAIALTATADALTAKRAKMSASVTSIMPELTISDDLLYLGAFTQTNINLKHKLIDKSIAIPAGGAVAAPTEWARSYLMWKFKRRPVRLRTQINACLMPERVPPRFSLPGSYSDMVYVDLKAAYWSMLKIFGWNTDYNPGQWWGLGDTLRDWFLEDHKLARNMLVSAVTVSHVCCWQGGALFWRKFNNPLANAPLWAAVQDTLHLIAGYAVRAGAVYVHTDGYIMPRRSVEGFADRLSMIGLGVGEKYSGDVAIYGVGRYQFPKSRRLDERERTPSTIYHINDVPASWMWARLTRFADIARYEARI